MTAFGNTNLFKNMTANEEETLKEMCYSLGVQHGGAYRIFRRVPKRLCRNLKELEMAIIRGQVTNKDLAERFHIIP